MSAFVKTPEEAHDARRALAPIARQDLPMETMARLAQLVAASEPGRCLPTEKELCEQLGVGRSTLREAVRSLAFIGAVQPRQGSGTFVSPSDDRTFERLIGLCITLQRAKVEEVIEFRRVLEVEAVRHAAMNHDAADAEELTSIMEAMAASAADPARASRYDLQFHATLARASHNTLLRTFLNGMRSLFQAWIDRAVNRQPVVEEIVKEHNAVLRAVLARNGELAAALMTAHLSHAAERLLAVVGRDHSTASYVSLLFK